MKNVKENKSRAGGRRLDLVSIPWKFDSLRCSHGTEYE